MSTVKKYKVTREELPALYLAASNASQTAQKRYIVFTVVNLILLIIGSISSSVSICTSITDASDTVTKSMLSFISFVTLGLSVLVTIVIHFTRFEKDWYAGRAIAESVKTLAWRYMTGATPYGISLSVAKVDEIFKNDLTQILNERKYMSGALGGPISTRPQVTDRMREIRKMSVGDRTKVYIDNRIEGQKKWYSSKSGSNKTWENVSFFIVGGTQLLALISAYVAWQYPDLNINPTGVFTTLATSFIAWSQVKQYHLLSQSYGLATQELGLIMIESKSIKTANDLSDFVLDSENAISREHTLWIARKEKVD